MKNSYRSDITGLRALAVIAVVGYHVGLSYTSAGYLGVDVFFVISGYLITLQLDRLRNGTLRAAVLEFYARRARRILPAFTIVLIATLLLGRIFLSAAGEQQEVGKSGLLAALFASNIFFWKRGDNYFSAPADSQLLLHTWSLSVEEQFYLLWPVVLCGLWWLQRRRSAAWAGRLPVYGVALLAAASLWLSFRWSRSDPDALFFLLPSRAWELATGALLALTLKEGNKPKLSAVLGAVGLASLVLATALLQVEAVALYLWAVLVAVAGAALVIAAGVYGQGSLVYRLLATRPMQFTGEISYAWYLWHWPLIGIGRISDMGSPNLMRDVSLALIAYVLAVLTTRYVESPIRRQQGFLWSSDRTSALAAACLVALAATLSVGLWLRAQSEFRASLAPGSLDCLRFGGPLHKADASCVLAGGHRFALFLVGDSHANQWSPVVAAWATAHEGGAVERSFSACAVPLTAENADVSPFAHSIKGTSACAAFSGATLAEIHSAAVSGTRPAVILSIHWTAHVNTASDAQERKAFEQTLDYQLDAFARIGVRVLLIGPTPEFAFDPPSCLMRRNDGSCLRRRLEHDEFTIPARELLASLARRHQNVRYWDPVVRYCDASWCYPSKDGVLMFRDIGHLSRAGAESAARFVTADLAWLVGTEASLR